MTKFRNLLSTRLFQNIARLWGNRDGNFGMMVGLLTVPMVISLGVSVDYVRAYNTKAKMQSDLDAGLIAAVKEVDSLDDTQIKTKVEQWFAAQTELDSSKYSLSDTAITISKTNRTITAVATGTISTTFLGIANIKSINVSVTSSVAGPATSFMNVYIVLDKSASMLLAATSSGQATMRSMISCEFACHDTADSVKATDGVTYPTYYAFAKAKGIQLRTDNALTAVSEVLDMIDNSNSSSIHIKVGLYSISTTAKEVLSPNASTTSQARKLLTDDTSGLTSATSVDGSYFDKSIPALQTLVGTAGDGSSAAKPLKLVLLLTDGAESLRNWVLAGVGNSNTWTYARSTTVKTPVTGTYLNKVAPLNPDWCSGMKTNGVTVGVLYTEYLAIPKDWGYLSTIGDTMKSANWYTTWGGTMRSDVSNTTSRRDYIPYALKDCATSQDLFISAASSTDIESGLSSLFTQYLSNVRLTQ
jgi:Flp pilus assembly protein TadG